MKNHPLVSVIVIFFNAQPYLEEAIQSILGQTYTNWELLLVDDGSTDGSTEVALKYVNQYPQQIFYCEHEGHQNRGMSATRNLGIQQARGIYLTFLDADDVWLPNTLADQVKLLEAYPDAAMVYGPIQWWYSWTGQPEDENRDFVDKVGAKTDSPIQPPTLFLLLLQRQIAIAGMLLRKEAVKSVGGFDEKFRGLYEDQVFCAKICLQYPVFVSSQCWYKYRQHPQSCCSVASRTEVHLTRQAFLQWVKMYISEKNIQNAKARQAVNWELFLAHHPVVLTIVRPLPFLLGLGQSVLPVPLLSMIQTVHSKITKRSQIRSLSSFD